MRLDARPDLGPDEVVASIQLVVGRLRVQLTGAANWLLAAALALSPPVETGSHTPADPFAGQGQIRAV